MNPPGGDGGPPPGRGQWRRRGVIGAIGSVMVGAEAASAQSPAQPSEAEDLTMRRAAPGSVSRSLSGRLEDLPLTPEDFGARGDGRSDDSDALAAAIAEAVRRRNGTIWLTGGRTYRISRTLVIPQGIAIVGPGSQGSASGYGCSIRHYSNGDLFVWDGSGEAFAGTGGGLRNLLIVKPEGFAGGTAISLVARDADHRPGEMFFENLLVYGEGGGARQGLWDHGLLVDGRAVDTEGARGVRSTRWVGCRFAGSRASGETILLRQVTHAFFLGCAIDQSGPAMAGVTLQGTNDNVHFAGAGIGGDLLIGVAGSGTVRNFSFSGKIGARFVNDDPGATGTLTASFDPPGRYVLINKAPGLRSMTNIDPGFRLALRRPATLAVSREPAAIGWDTVVHDRGNTMGVPTDRYQCMCAGLHRFSATLAFTPARAGRFILSFIRFKANGRRELISTAVQADAGGSETCISHDAMIDLAYGDEVAVALAAAEPAAGPVRLAAPDERTGIGCRFDGAMSG